MKLNKFFLGLLGMSLFTFAACSDDDDKYEWATVSGEQVFFSTDLSSTINLTKDAKSFNIPVNRSNTAAATTVQLNVSNDSKFINIPTSVSFQPGDSVVNLVVTYNPDSIDYDDYTDIAIQIADSLQNTPFGARTYEFSAGIPSPYTSLGMATITDDIFTTWYGVDNVSWQVEIQENDLVPGLYRLVNAYNSLEFPYNEPGDFDESTHYFYIHAEDPEAVYFDQTFLGVDWGKGEFNVISFASYYMSKGGTLEEQKAKGICGTLKDGYISFPVKAILGARGDDGWYYCNTNGKFSILLPGYSLKDFTAELSYSGIFTDAEGQAFAEGNLTLGADATDARAIVVAADADPDAVADAIVAGDVETTAVEAGQIRVPIAEGLSGNLSLIVVVLDGEDVKQVVNADFEYYGGGANPWQKLGAAIYTDDFIVPFYGEEDENGNFVAYDPFTYPVEIEENTETPGLYRLKNLYATVAQAFGVTGGNKDILIHAENPNAVYFLTQPTGFDIGSGEYSIVSYGGDDIEYFKEKSGASAEDVIAALPEDFGTLKDGVITLPEITRVDGEGNPVLDEEGNALKYQGYLYRSDGKGWYSCTNCAFKLVLPSADSEVRASASRMAKAAKFQHTMMSMKYAYKKAASRKTSIVKAAKRAFRM